MTKTVILTGGSQGIGKATLAKFIAEGWHGINISRHPCNVSGIININQDLTVDDLQDQLEKKLLPLLADNQHQLCLVHNACHYLSDKIGTMSPKDFQLALTLNLMAPNILNNLLIPLMAQDSSIIYVGSTLSEKAVPNCASYVITKHGLVGMMRATCQDLSGRGITTCCICPGITDTNMLREHCQHDETIINALTALSTAERLIEPAEIADVVWYSANTPVLNGSVIHANTGQKER